MLQFEKANVCESGSAKFLGLLLTKPSRDSQSRLLFCVPSMFDSLEVKVLFTT